MSWGSPAEHQTKLRMLILMAAYVYEFEPEQEPLCSDHEFDQACLMVDLSIDTNRPHLDEWFRREFDPSTGSWIGKFPELEGIRLMVERKRKSL